MGIWVAKLIRRARRIRRVRKNINIGQSLAEIQKNPDFKFCWIKDNQDFEKVQNKNGKDCKNRQLL